MFDLVLAVKTTKHMCRRRRRRRHHAIFFSTRRQITCVKSYQIVWLCIWTFLFY